MVRENRGNLDCCINGLADIWLDRFGVDGLENCSPFDEFPPKFFFFLFFFFGFISAMSFP
jgi:hypothetical protein